jgi:twinkle protein
MGTDRLFFYDHFGSTSVENIVGQVRYLSKAHDCKYVFLDHLSIIVSAQENGDERKAIDEVMTRLRMLTQETGIALFLVSHLRRPSGKGHEEGAATSLSDLRGSASIAQLSDIVLGFERNGQAPSVEDRNTTYIRVLKNRFSGETGLASAVTYDQDTGRMSEITMDEEIL